MNHLYRVSLYVAIGLVGFIAGILSSQAYSTIIYNQVQKELQLYLPEETTVQAAENTMDKVEEESTQETQEGVTQEVSTMQEAKITADTIYVVEEYDGAAGTMEEIIESMPAKYMGLTRTLLEEELVVYTDAPSLTDQQKGFVSTNLVSFSEAKVVVRKNYYLEEAIVAPSYYFLRSEEGRILVYAYDLQTLYLTTDIMIESLPDDLQEEILQIKRLDSEEDVYQFLEAYSS
ncbi:MAG: hypothetical protein R3Y67_06260 [Eubacteriales bacterium]